MRTPREISAEEENFRLVPTANFNVIRRDPVQPEPIGTILLVPMRVVGYDPDCDGSLMARFEWLHFDELDDEPDPEILALPDAREAQLYGISTHRGIYPTTGIVATPDEIRALIPESSVTDG